MRRSVGQGGSRGLRSRTMWQKCEFTMSTTYTSRSPVRAMRRMTLGMAKTDRVAPGPTTSGPMLTSIAPLMPSFAKLRASTKTFSTKPAFVESATWMSMWP
eukprot:1119746-Alexandrium_andersonii.AAC.1